MASVDQQRVRRTHTGLIAHDPARALPGYTLFAPMLGDGTAHLVDMDGTVVHSWRLPYRPGCYGYLLDKRLETSPVLTLIFGLLGFGGGMFEVIRRLTARRPTGKNQDGK